jgi:hypothetical protein
VEKRRTARQARDDSNMLGMRFAFWTTRTTGTYLEYVLSTYCFSTAKFVTLTRLNVTFIRIFTVLKQNICILLNSSSVFTFSYHSLTL